MGGPAIPVGSSFGRWVTTGEPVRPPGRHWHVPCRCACGTERTVRRYNLLHSDPGRASRSCGCLKRDRATERHRALLESINAGRGATVTPPPVGSASSTDNTAVLVRIANRLERVEAAVQASAPAIAAGVGGVINGAATTGYMRGGY